MPEYTGTRLNDEIKISRLYTVHYFEYSKRFSFTGESHDFWELVYADKGDCTVFADDKSFVLEQDVYKRQTSHIALCSSSIPDGAEMCGRLYNPNSDVIIQMCIRDRYRAYMKRIGNQLTTDIIIL